MKLSRERLSNFFSDFKNFWDDLKVEADVNKLTKWYNHFKKDYPEVFTVEMEVNKAAFQPHREEKLAKVKKRLLQNRSPERFTDYDDIRFDQNLMAAERIITYQKAIDDATRRKIHFASFQGELLEGCFKESKKAYTKTLKEVKIGVRWAKFLRKLHKLAVVYNQLIYCTVSLRYIHCNFKLIEEICETDPGN